MKNIFKNKKAITIIAIIASVILLAIGGTFAWYFWSTSDDEKTRIVTGVGAATVIYDSGTEIIGQYIKPVEDKSMGLVKNIKVRTNMNTANKISFNLYLDINELGDGLKEESFRYELWKEGEEKAIVSGNFTQASLDENLVACEKSDVEHIVLLKDVTINTTISNYILYIWIDGVNYTNPSTMMNQNFAFELHADGQGAVINDSKVPNLDSVTAGTLAHAIMNNYNYNHEQTVNNGGMKYYYNPYNKLISDIDGNVRYYGSNPNNYVYFNCENYDIPSSSTCELWRIIGVFDGKVKLVKEQNIGSYAWDDTNTGSYSNNWQGSEIEEFLNNGYYNNTDGIGLTENTRNNSLVANNVWYLNGINTAGFSDQVYIAEKNGSNTWMGKVGMMSASDYGYATDFTKCSSELYAYDDSECTSNNWIYSMGQGDSMWLIPPKEEISTVLWSISSDGKVISEDNTSSSYNVYPTVYLEDDVLWYGGDGTKTDPYIVYPSGVEENKGNAIEYISSLYNSYNKDVVTNNGIEYNYASTVSLMNDRLGGTTSDYNAGNIRYYGANPNNYVDIGDRDSSGRVIPYRIIGIFKDMELSDGTKKDLIKVIRADSIGTYAWDNKTSGIGSSVHNYGSNDWTDARLMMLLNPGYDKYSESNPLLDNEGNTLYGYKGSLWWNSGGGTCYSGSSNGTKACTFTSIGLSSDVHDKIETVVWNLSGNSTNTVYSNAMYTSERGKSVYSGHATEWTGKVALMYVSDYGYATDFKQCNAQLKSYDTSACRTNDWLYINNINQWSLTPLSSATRYIRPIHSSGRITDYNAYNAVTVRPSFYLDSELNIESGIGTIKKPYVLS